MKIAILSFTAIAVIGSAFAADRVREITLPPETAVYPASELPGYALVNATCLTCHSVEYSKYQPPTSPRAYWQATVVKMQKVFGAPIADEHVAVLVDYLVKTYGNERPGEKPVSSGATSAPK